ncbi:hypothetical protein Syun_019277 [Stephania yunnanensis]|uniref:Uncharacterized protein n=1 Tax=Stephania yunnanensis TaxID=152371 RepID=A0AAP0NXU0_9MAGN
MHLEYFVGGRSPDLMEAFVEKLTVTMNKGMAKKKHDVQNHPQVEQISVAKAARDVASIASSTAGDVGFSQLPTVGDVESDFENPERICMIALYRKKLPIEKKKK